MNTLKMKITGYDQETHSLLVAFASDQNKSQDPADYQSYAFQPIAMWPDIQDLEEIKLRIAQSGVSIVEQQIKREQLNEDVTLSNQMRDSVGEVKIYNINELVAPVATAPFQVI